MILMEWCVFLLTMHLIQGQEIKSLNEEDFFKDLSDVFSKVQYLTSFAEVSSVIKNPYSKSRLGLLISGPLQMHDVLDKDEFWEINGTTLSHSVISQEHTCAADIFYTMIHVNRHWALQMLDSFGKLPSGLLYGNHLWIGSYRECIEAYAPKKANSSFGNFHGQYCSALWNVNIPNNVSVSDIPLSSGVCLPDSCNSASVENSVHHILQYLGHLPFVKRYSSVLTLKSLSCDSKYKGLDTATISFIFVLCLIAFLMICGTLLTLYSGTVPSTRKTEIFTGNNYIVNASVLEEGNFFNRGIPSAGDSITNHDYSENFDDRLLLTAGSQSSRTFPQSFKLMSLNCCKSFKSGICAVLKCFCALTNARKILNTENLDGQLTCVHGIRFLSMTWIILGHTYVHSIEIIDNIVDALRDIDNWPSQVVIRGTFSVDSFFLLSGFLMAYQFLKRADLVEGRINWLYLYIHRYLRLTPALAVLLGFNILCFKYLGSGPFWYEDSDIEYCKSNWWWNLLYINNFLSLNKMCIASTWYLANDMQFFVLTSFYLYILWRWPKIGLSIVSILLLSGWISTWIISDAYKVIPLLAGMEGVKNSTVFQDEILQAWDKLYSKPYSRIGPYLIGVILAYVLYKTSNRQRFLRPWHLLLGWSLATFCCISVIYGLYHVNGNQMMYNFYNALSRSSFSLGLAWVIYVCLIGHGGIVNQILSFKVWIPLSRITYCVYLVHPLLMKWYFQNLKTPVNFSHSLMGMYFLGFLCLSYAIGFMATLAFESPILNIDKLVFQRNLIRK